MNEQTARDVVLVRAVESADTARVIFTNQDRAHASRAAAELARWRASELKQAASAEMFIGQRAELLSQTLAKRQPLLARAARAFEWPAWINAALPVAAFMAGALVEQIADRQHVNILAFPLMAIVLWNVVVYALLTLRALVGAVGAGLHFNWGGPRRWLAALGKRSLRKVTGGAAADVFVAQWSAMVAPLMAARAARVLHLAAALFAVGALAGMYVRGLVFEYRVGWESTFLDATAVHAILSFFLEPAARLLAVTFPTAADIASIQFSGAAPANDAPNAARWIHLYAVTVASAVILPRLALTGLAAWQTRRRSRRFAFDMNEAYFRRLAGSFVAGPARLRVVPYSYTPDQMATDGLRTLAKTLLGDDAEVTLTPVVAFGAESSARAAIADNDAHVRLTAALFNLSATPETENHGAFLKSLRDAAGTARLIALVDESGYRRRLGADAGAAGSRLAERSDAWRYFCRTAGVDVAFSDLHAPDLAAVERDFGIALTEPVSSP